MRTEDILKNAVKAMRQEELNNSPQLLLGELILKLESVTDKTKPLHIDIEDKRPMGVGSWRGIYEELAIQTESLGSCCTDEVTEERFGYTFYKSEAIGKESPTVGEWIDVLKSAIGKRFEGYKGGYYVMGKNTPVWLAEYGDSSFPVNGEYENVYFANILETPDRVYLVTGIESD